MHKIGPYIAPAHWSREHQEKLKNLQPIGMKTMDFLPSRPKQFHADVPHTEHMFRDFPLSDQHSDMWLDPKATGIRHAKDWAGKLDRWAKEGMQIPREQILCMGINEPEVWRTSRTRKIRYIQGLRRLTEAQARTREAIAEAQLLLSAMLAADEKEMDNRRALRAAGTQTEGTKVAVEYNYWYVETAHSEGIRVPVANMAVGWPTNHGIIDAPSDWGPWAEVLALAEKYGFPVSLHEYSDNRGVHQHWGWWMGRYTHLLESGLFKGDIIIGECGIEMGISDISKFGDGWQTVYTPEKYAAFLMDYNAELIKSPQLRWAAVYMMDYADNYWRTMDITPMMHLLPKNDRFYFGPNPIEPKPEPKPEPEPMPQANIIDVSHHNGDINWPLVKSAGVEGAIVKMTEGSGHTDTKFEQNVMGAANAGLFVAVYHYFWGTISPQAQADNIIRNLRGRIPSFIAIDVERVDTQPVAERTAALKELLRILEEKRYNLVIYTGRWFWNVYIARSAEWKKYPLWIASYTSWSDTIQMPADWSEWLIWQYTSSGRINGIQGNVDLNWGKHDIAWFKERFGGARTPEDNLRQVLLARSAQEQLLQYNWNASLLQNMNKEGFVPVSNEFIVNANGKEYVAQGAEHTQRPGQHRVYYAPTNNYGDVRFVER